MPYSAASGVDFTAIALSAGCSPPACGTAAGSATTAGAGADAGGDAGAGTGNDAGSGAGGDAGAVVPEGAAVSNDGRSCPQPLQNLTGK
jgi:hypothetical protein